MFLREPQRGNGSDLNLIRQIAVILVKLLAGRVGKQIESEQATVSVQFAQWRQRRRRKDAAPDKSGSLSCAVQRIVPMEEAFPLRSVGNPMQWISLPALLKSRSARGFRDACKLRQYADRIIGKRGMGAGGHRRAAVCNRDRVLLRYQARHQLPQRLRHVLRFHSARRIDLFRGLDFAQKQADVIHRVQQTVCQLSGIACLAASHHSQQILPGMQHARHLRESEQTAVALQRVHATKEFVEDALIGGRVFQLHQLLAGGFQQVAGLGEELLQQWVRG